LSYSNGIDAFVDSGNAFSAIDVCEYGPCRSWLGAGLSLFMTGDFDRFHACRKTCHSGCCQNVRGKLRKIDMLSSAKPAERNNRTHGSISLSNTACHTTEKP
jgi:hypothetical protein